ncbi:Kef-type potassium/proton antiporter (CPA2 family) [Rhodobacter sp. JA431]|uniref:cation:proton antiporter domain-containing protein n=1 Tax=Rhodobacter sp. JA431 TaxID=570013 RepID=UPI000BD90E8D|nr:cation:proton antiporter [Rhodobacter sp. JA431]SOB91891.1 Kef-type potassium/proton antiporter (CPA2 family) [Rhodobacter sp. JA431]
MENFLLQATLYLTAMVVAVPLATRLGLGSVLGYLLAGIIIGPIFGFVADEAHDLQHFAEFGVVMMLFLIGLEMNPRALWSMRDKLIGLGGLQLLITIAAVAAVALAVGQPPRAAIALGGILALSSTAIVMQTLNEKRLMQTAGGRSGFAVLLMQDIAVIPMLALLPLLALPGARELARGDMAGHSFAAQWLDALPAWGMTLITFGAVGLIVMAGHFLIQPLFRFVQASRLPEVHTAVALMIVVGIASLMNLVGLSPALGTFLAGLVLADSEFKHELEANVEPFKGLLMGLFFIAVGAGIDLKVFFAGPLKIIALVVALVALKSAILYVLGRLFGLRGSDRWLFAFGLAQAGEFSLVLVSFATAQRILPPAVAEKVLLVIALSMLISPVLFLLHERLSKRVDPGVGPDPDTVDEHHPIIIAGAGRFGQVVNRMVTMSGFATTVIDSDLPTVQRLRTFGFKAYYGDPTRPQLLAAAGLSKARVLVVALDDKKATTELVAYARSTRPDLHIITRARDRYHVYDLYAAGANDIVREMFDGSCRAGRYVLENVGLSAYEAHELERMFWKLDRSSVRDLAEVWQPGVPVERNRAYVDRLKELNAVFESQMTSHIAERRRGDGKAPQDADVIEEG